MLTPALVERSYTIANKNVPFGATEGPRYYTIATINVTFGAANRRRYYTIATKNLPLFESHSLKPSDFLRPCSGTRGFAGEARCGAYIAEIVKLRLYAEPPTWSAATGNSSRNPI